MQLLDNQALIDTIVNSLIDYIEAMWNISSQKVSFTSRVICREIHTPQYFVQLPVVVPGCALNVRG